MILISSGFRLEKAATSAWDGSFERGDWDWSRNGFHSGKALLRYESRNWDKKSEHSGYSLGNCGYGSVIRWNCGLKYRGFSYGLRYKESEQRGLV